MSSFIKILISGFPLLASKITLRLEILSFSKKRLLNPTIAPNPSGSLFPVKGAFRTRRHAAITRAHSDAHQDVTGKQCALSPAGRKNFIHQFYVLRRKGPIHVSFAISATVFLRKLDSSRDLYKQKPTGRPVVVHVKRTGFVNLNALRHSSDTWWSSVCATRVHVHTYEFCLSWGTAERERATQLSVLPSKHAIAWA